MIQIVSKKNKKHWATHELQGTLHSLCHGKKNDQIFLSFVKFKKLVIDIKNF